MGVLTDGFLFKKNIYIYIYVFYIQRYFFVKKRGWPHREGRRGGLGVGADMGA